MTNGILGRSLPASERNGPRIATPTGCYHASVPSRLALVALVLANLVPLVGVAFWGWSVGAIVLLYWIENGIVGLSNLAKMALAAAPDEARVSKLFLLPFFALHYGVFWVVHGAFVMILFGASLLGPGSLASFGAPSGPFDLDLSSGLPAGAGAGSLAWGVASLALSHAVSFVTNYLRGGEFREVTAAQLMARPYGRVVVLHVTIIFGAIAVTMLGAPLGAMIVLVIAKTVIDVRAHLREHTVVAGRPAILGGNERAVRG